MAKVARTRAKKNWHSLPEYEALRALIQSGTATAAAAELGLSQSAISRSIASLEHRLGVTFFERKAGRLHPTQEAIDLNTRLDPLFDALDHIDAHPTAMQDTLRISAPPSLAHPYLSDQIGRFMKLNPDIFVSFDINTPMELTQKLIDDEVDLGMVGVDTTRAGISQMLFRTCIPVCAMRRDHEYATRSVILPEDLDGQYMLTYSSHLARRGQFERILKQANSRPIWRGEMAAAVASVELVRAGIGIAIMNPFPVSHYSVEDVVFIPFQSPMSYRVYFNLPESRPVPRAARAFIRHLKLNTPTDPFSDRE